MSVYCVILTSTSQLIPQLLMTDVCHVTLVLEQEQQDQLNVKVKMFSCMEI